MKLTLLFSTLLISQLAFGQAFDKGTVAIDLGVGLGLYRSSSNDKNAKNEGAGTALIPFNIEFGLSKRIGLGFTGTYGSFIANPDSSNGAYNLCLGIRPSFHFYNGEKTTMDVHAIVGMTGMTYFEEKPSQSRVQIRGAGANFVVGLGFKHYIIRPIGIFVNLDYAGYNYRKFEDDKGALVRVNNPPEDFQFKMSGVNTTLGLAIKF